MANLYWDPTGTDGDGVISGGSGTWTPAGRSWTTADGLVQSAAAHPIFCFFDGTPGTVTVDGAVNNPLRMTFDVAGYSLNGDDLTFTNDFQQYSAFSIPLLGETIIHNTITSSSMITIYGSMQFVFTSDANTASEYRLSTGAELRNLDTMTGRVLASDGAGIDNRGTMNAIVAPGISAMVIQTGATFVNFGTYEGVVSMQESTFINPAGAVTRPDAGLIAINSGDGVSNLGREATIVNRGTIDGDIDIGGTTDRVRLLDGSVNGTVTLGLGDDKLVIAGGAIVTGEISGEGGNDTLIGGAGGDRLKGGGGADTFLFGDAGDLNARAAVRHTPLLSPKENSHSQRG